jgi:hypothetical protein
MRLRMSGYDDGAEVYVSLFVLQFGTVRPIAGQRVRRGIDSVAL